MRLSTTIQMVNIMGHIRLSTNIQLECLIGFIKLLSTIQTANLIRTHANFMGHMRLSTNIQLACLMVIRLSSTFQAVSLMGQIRFLLLFRWLSSN